jgi:hypothetical protein
MLMDNYLLRKGLKFPRRGGEGANIPLPPGEKKGADK